MREFIILIIFRRLNPITLFQGWNKEKSERIHHYHLWNIKYDDNSTFCRGETRRTAREFSLSPRLPTRSILSILLVRCLWRRKRRRRRRKRRTRRWKKGSRLQTRPCRGGEDDEKEAKVGAKCEKSKIEGKEKEERWRQTKYGEGGTSEENWGGVISGGKSENLRNLTEKRRRRWIVPDQSANPIYTKVQIQNLKLLRMLLLIMRIMMIRVPPSQVVLCVAA